MVLIGVVVSGLLERYEQAPAEVRRLIDTLLANAEADRLWSGQVGPAYRQGQVAQLLGKTKQAVSADRGLLRVTQRDGTVTYPVVQFDGDRVCPGVATVVQTFAPVVATDWTTASWLTSPNPDLDGLRPIDALRRGEVTQVTTLAERAARRMAH